jgi:DNA-binding HxlR family transcriptional regulator
VRSYSQYCPVAKALDVVGDRWTLLIVRELLIQGGCRYTDLVTGLPGIATNLLVERLRELEATGIVRREATPPPVATTLYHLTGTGRELGSVLRALGRWGTRFMADPVGDDAFRGHWLAFTASEYLQDNDPTGPPVSIEIRTGDRPAVVEVAAGQVRPRLGTAVAPDLVLSGDPPAIVGLLSGRLSLAQARQRGLRVTGESRTLDRLQRRVLSEASRSSN